MAVLSLSKTPELAEQFIIHWSNETDFLQNNTISVLHHLLHSLRSLECPLKLTLVKSKVSPAEMLKLQQLLLSQPVGGDLQPFSPSHCGWSRLDENCRSETASSAVG